jgi:hypothetical protein
MKTLRFLRLTSFPVAVLALLCTTACVSWKPGWKAPTAEPEAGDFAVLLKQAVALENRADDAEKVKQLIDAYGRVAAVDSNHCQALWKMGNYHILAGAGYGTSKRDKKFHYLEALRCCERAMYTNLEFRKEVDSGRPVWEACGKLGPGEVDAMGYWYTAIFHCFDECLRPAGRLLNARLIVRTDPFMKRIDELDPNWAGGGNYFSRAIYLIALPERYGGSKVKADELFTKAIAAGPNHLANRWGRARYLYPLLGNRDGYVSDLQWVLDQDPHESGNTYPWNVYFQRQAKEMLNRTDEVFGSGK